MLWCVVRLCPQGCLVEAAYEREELVDLDAERMVRALSGKQLMRQLPDTRFKHQDPKRDHRKLPTELLHEEHRANNERHASQREERIKPLPQRSRV